MKISVVIPVYNEKNTIVDLIERVKSVPFEKEIIIVDDYSTDGSREIVRTFADDVTRVLLQARNRGKGAALRTAFRYAAGDIVIIQDADLEYDPAHYPALIRPIVEGKADVVYGSRFITGEYRRLHLFGQRAFNKFLTLLSNMFTSPRLTDIETGCKVFRREVLDKIEIEENRFGFEPEIIAKIAQLDARICETGIPYSARTHKDGKKRTWKSGLSSLRCILQYNLISPRGKKTDAVVSSLQKS